VLEKQVSKRRIGRNEGSASPVEALGEWLNGFHWTHWATFTFRPGCPRDCPQEHHCKSGWGSDGPSTSRARHHTERFLNTLPGPRLGYFYCVERGGIGGRAHAHALLSIEPVAMGVTGKSIDHAWGSRFGRCQLRSYDPELGAAHYCGKYITKAPLSWDVGGPMMRG